MDKAKRAQTAETPKQPSLGLKLRAPYLYPDRAYSASAPVYWPVTDGRFTFHCGKSVPRAHHWQLDPNFRTNPSGSRHGRIVPCVTCIAGPHGDAQLYER